MTEENVVKVEETSLVVADSGYIGHTIDRDKVRNLGEALMSMHPSAAEVGAKAMFTVAQLALVTGANPMPATNGIHVWKSKDKVQIQFGIGFWRSQAEIEGGMLWIIPPRPMSEKEREEYSIMDTQLASICSGCLTKNALDLLRDAKSMGIGMSLSEAKMEVARTGIAIVTKTEYAKVGRPLQWTADERAERDLLRKLVPVMQRVRERAISGEFVEGGEGWRVSDFVRSDKPELQVGADYSADDANYDLIDYDDPTKRPQRPATVTEDGEIIEVEMLTPEQEEENEALFEEVVDDQEQVAEETPAEEVEGQDEEIGGEGPVEELETASIAGKPEGPLSDIDQAIYDSNTMEEWIKLNLEAIPRYNVSQALHGTLKKIGYASGFNEVPIITGRDKVPENIATKREKRLQISREIRAYAAKRDAEEE